VEVEHRHGVVVEVGTWDFFFVEDVESGEKFFCHQSRVVGGVIPREGANVSFHFLPLRVPGKQRPISHLEVCNDLR
jgi:hypothetical protein